ncbi:hypothetical protein JOQ06_000306 [Pogonophryne albipinna]|uniref:Uncharacterized protein n=1 Tax=Pogonophryne albipinna TaxID=1090488 RepID=A0AAD6AF16_9TELE|nr:hypothetical protein JOQ06_000306 [Pogonophryne albipinna]
MNPGAFSSSGPLSWAMYLMRKGRTGSGLFEGRTQRQAGVSLKLIRQRVELTQTELTESRVALRRDEP